MTATIEEVETKEAPPNEEDEVLHIVCCYKKDMDLDKIRTLCGIKASEAGADWTGSENDCPYPKCKPCQEFKWLHRHCVKVCIYREHL